MKSGMTVLFLMALLLLKVSTTEAEPLEFLWVAQAGGADQDCGEAVATDNSGMIIVPGYFDGTATFGDTTLVSAGGYDIFIAKYDEGGTLHWVVQEGGASYENATSIATDSSSNIIVIGGFMGTATIGDSTFVSAGSSDIFIAKYDERGDFLWAAQAGGPETDNALGIATDSSGNVIGVGSFVGTATFGDTTLTSRGSLDIYAAKYDGAGNFLWATQAGGTSLDTGYGVATDGCGNSIMTGHFRGTATFGGPTGDTTLVSAGTQDMFVAKYDPTGNLLWAAQAGGTAGTAGYGVATDESGNNIVTGEFRDTATFGDTTLVTAGGYDILVAKCDSAGHFLWAVQAGGAGDDDGRDVDTDDAGNVIVTGRFVGTATFGDTTMTSSGYEDIFIARCNSAGNFLWAAQGGGASGDGGFGIAMDGSGSPVVTGYFSYIATFGDTTLTSAGELDVFVAKLGAEPEAIEGEFVRPGSFELLQNSPNPFNPTTTLRFRTGEDGMVSLRVYDVAGREVQRLLEEHKPAGTHMVLWNGRSTAGEQLPSGVYFYRLQGSGSSETRGMALVR